MGTPKQHISLGQQSLMERTVGLACDLTDALSTRRAPLLISGAYLTRDCHALAASADPRPVAHHYNAAWAEGMRSSIDCARRLADADGVLVLLMDQYRVDLADLVRLYDAWCTEPTRPAAAVYEDTVGPPVIWPHGLWSIREDRGAAPERLNKRTLVAHRPLRVDIPHAALDLDTREDLQHALHRDTSDSPSGHSS